MSVFQGNCDKVGDCVFYSFHEVIPPLPHFYQKSFVVCWLKMNCGFRLFKQHGNIGWKKPGKNGNSSMLQ